MISTPIFGRYARSLVDIVFEENQEPAVMLDLKMYSDIFRAVPDLLGVFHSPAVRRDAKERLLAELISRYPVTPLIANFLRTLLRHNRILYFQEIFDGCVKLVNDRKGIVSAQVATAAPLSEQEIQRLSQSLTRVTGKSVNMNVQTDAALLGGLVVQVGSTIYDGSLRTQLAEMKRRLAEN